MEVAKSWEHVSVYALTYSHKHGEEVSLYSSFEQAERSAVDVVLQWIREVDSEQAESAKLQAVLQNG